MARKYATADAVGRDQLLEFVAPAPPHGADHVPRRRIAAVLTGHRRRRRAGPAGDRQLSTRAKAVNIRRSGRASVVVLSDEFNGPYVQIDGTAEVIDLPEAVEPLVDYFRAVAGEHSDWAEYRQAMVDQGKCLIRVTPQTWGAGGHRRLPAARADHVAPAARRRHMRSQRGGDGRCALRRRLRRAAPIRWQPAVVRLRTGPCAPRGQPGVAQGARHHPGRDRASPDQAQHRPRCALPVAARPPGRLAGRRARRDRRRMAGGDAGRFGAAAALGPAHRDSTV